MEDLTHTETDIESANEVLLPDHWFQAEVVHAAAPEAGRRAAIYSRYSYLGKRESSIERQDEVCTTYIEANRLVVVGKYPDRARTGTTQVGREALERMLKDAAEDKFDIVVVEDIDRLGRALEVTVDIWKQLKDLDIELHDSELGKLTPGQIGAKAGASDEERRKIVKRNREGKRRKVRGGQWSGPASFGYRRVLVGDKSSKTKVEIDPVEGPVVKEIFELYDKGVSVDRIAEILNERPASGRGNRYWTGTAIRGSKKYGSGILRRLKYIGANVHGRITVTKKKGKLKDKESKYEVKTNPRHTWATGKLDKALIIIDRERFDRVQARLLREARDTRDPMWTVKHYPLGGLLYCASCGGKMTPTLKRNDGNPRAICNRNRNPKKIKPGQKSCGNFRSTSTDQIDDMVREIVCTEVPNPVAFEKFVEEYNLSRKALAEADESDRPKLEREVADLEAQRSEYWEQREVFGEDFVKPKVKAIRESIAEKKRQIAELAARPKTILKFDRDVAGTLVSDIDAVFSPNFDSMTATGALVFAGLRNLVAKVVVDITDETTNIEVEFRLAAIVKGDAGDAVIKFSRSRPRTGHNPLHSELRRIDDLVKTGTRALRDEEWNAVAPLLPDCVRLSKQGNGVGDARVVIDAALLHLHEGVPLSRMPAAFGEPLAVFSALKRLSSSGAWDIVAGKLREIAPDRLPAKSTNMFSTLKGRYSSSLRSLPKLRAEHGVEMEAGKHALGDDEWRLVTGLVPEQVLTVYKEPARISPRRFLHGVLYMIKSGTPISNMPLQLGSEAYFRSCIARLVQHGYWDRIVERLQAQAPDVLVSADLSRLDIYPRSPQQRSVFRRAVAKIADLTGVPEHAPSDAEWALVNHLFPSELLYVNDKLAVETPRRLAHAIFYRVKEKIPYEAFPPYFGDPQFVRLTVTKFVFHHLWEAMVEVLTDRSPETLADADMAVFTKYKRGRTRRYAHLLPAVEQATPPHAPTDAQWALVSDLVSDDLLVVRGKPAIMEGRKFLHALMFMAMERVMFGGLPKAFFGDANDIRFAVRKLVRHHYWDTIVERLRLFDPDWAEKANLTLFDRIDRSKNEQPEFRKHRVRRSTGHAAGAG